MRIIAACVFILLTGHAGAAAAVKDGGNPPLPGISAQGRIRQTPTPLMKVSPRAGSRMEIVPSRAGFHAFEAALRIECRNGSIHRIPRVSGNEFLVSDVERIVAFERFDTNAVPARLSVLDFHGRELMRRDVHGLTDPSLSSDGTGLAYRAGGEIVVIDLSTFAETRYPNLDLFTAGPGGTLAGVSPDDGYKVVIRDPRAGTIVLRLDDRPRKVGFSWDGSSVFLLTPGKLIRLALPEGRLETLFAVSSGAELRDFLAAADAIYLGRRRIDGDRASGALVTLDAGGRFVNVTPEKTVKIRKAPWQPEPPDIIPWPIKPNGQHPVGNTYCEYQNYGGSPYVHPGVDVLGDPWQPVYAVRSGVVKAVLTTSGQWHWRVAVGDEDTTGTTEGYLYAHLDEFSIAVNAGDPVAKGQYLGDLVEWPSYDFTHCHFARIQDKGAKWYGNWLNTENPHIRFWIQTETEPPVFDPAKGGDLFAFCQNQTSSYLSPSKLRGEVDIIARVGDRIASNWVCTVQEIRYTIYPLGNPGAPVVDDKLSVFFDMAVDTYQGGPIDPFLVDLLYKDDWICDTKGDYDDREFYHIITNSDGNQIYEQSDLYEAWDTTQVADGDYVIEVTAVDAAGNAAVESMVVTVDN